VVGGLKFIFAVTIVIIHLFTVFMNRFVFCFCLVALSALQLRGQITEINVVRTPMHVSFPGTSFSMIPPSPSFVLSDRGPAFVNKEDLAGISVIASPMTFESMWSMIKNGGNSPQKKTEYVRELRINGNDAKLVKFSEGDADVLGSNDKVRFTVIMMLYKYGNACYQISATYPTSKEDKFGKVIEMSIMSFLYDSDKAPDPLDMLAFSVNFNETPLKFFSMIYQIGAMYSSKVACETQKQYCDMTFSTMMSPFGVEKAEQKENTIKRVQKPFGNEVEIKSVNEVTFGGLKGYEVVGHEKDENGKVILKAVVILYDKDRYFELSGKALDNFEGSLVVFRKVFESFKLK